MPKTSTTTWMKTEQGKTVVVNHARIQENYAYSAYDEKSVTRLTVNRLGFNSERIDPVSGQYHIGNGYRAYHPSLMRFTAPNSMSPFGASGINSYAYCVDVPINKTVLTGHFSVLGLFFNIEIMAFDVATDDAAAPVEALVANRAERVGRESTQSAQHKLELD